LTVEYGDNVTSDGAFMLAEARGRARAPRLVRILALPPTPAARRLRFARNVGGRFP